MRKTCIQIGSVLMFCVLVGLQGYAQNEFTSNDPSLVNGAVGLDSRGIIRTVRDASLEGLDMFKVDENGVPTQFDIFQFGFDAFRDMEAAANGAGQLTGILALDKFAGVHSLTVTGAGLTESAPQIGYRDEILAFNAANPTTAITLPYFPFSVDIDSPDDGLGRDLELAVDWSQATNAFQGYYILDAYAGVHYVNNAKVLNMLAQNPGRAGINKFFDIFGFRPIYLDDFAGQDINGVTLTKPEPYFLFTNGSGIPIAKDLEVMTRFETLTTPYVDASKTRQQLAMAEGIDDESDLFQPIAISSDRLNPANTNYTPSVAITNGYAILDGFGAVHTLLEDANGNPIPAPWEDTATGLVAAEVDAPYFANDPVTEGGDDFNIAIDIEIFPNGKGYALLTRLGEVFVVNGLGTTAADNFVQPGIETRIPIFGFDAARDLELVSNKEGKIVGMYVVDRFGTIHRAGQIPSLPSKVMFFPAGYALDMEVSPIQGAVTGPAYR